MKRFHRVLCGLACAAVACASLAGAAEAHKSTPSDLPVTRGSQYLALGDSVTFGYMEPAVVPAPNYASPSSFLGYPEQLAAELHLTVANAACPGETSSSFINPSAPSNTCENNPSGSNANYRMNYPLHVSYSGSQLAYALSYLHTHHNVRLVSLMLGANDFLRCAETTSDGCTSSTEELTAAYTLSTNLRTILTGIRGKAHYKGQLVVVNYYSPYTTPALIAQSLGINKLVDQAAQPFHAEVADGFGEFAAAAAHSGGDPCAAGLLTQVGGGKCGIHPSYAGQALLAQAVEKAIKLG